MLPNWKTLPYSTCPHSHQKHSNRIDPLKLDNYFLPLGRMNVAIYEAKVYAVFSEQLFDDIETSSPESEYCTTNFVNRKHCWGMAR